MADERSASMLELKAIDVPQGHYDVAILGGGLDALTMALQLERERPETSYADDRESVWPGPARLLPGILEMDLEGRGVVVAA
jgi:hypothetical protein